MHLYKTSNLFFEMIIASSSTAASQSANDSSLFGLLVAICLSSSTVCIFVGGIVISGRDYVHIYICMAHKVECRILAKSARHWALKA